MFSAKDIWEAGRKALGLPTATAPAAPAPAPAAAAPDAADDVFDPSTYDFQPGAYRIHFRNGCSGEYDGAVLAQQFPFDPQEVVDVRPVAEVGQG